MIVVVNHAETMSQQRSLNLIQEENMAGINAVDCLSLLYFYDWFPDKFCTYQ